MDSDATPTPTSQECQDGQPTGAEGGGATVLGGRVGGLSFLTFVSLVRLILLVACPGGGLGRCHRAHSWTVRQCAAIPSLARLNAINRSTSLFLRAS